MEIVNKSVSFISLVIIHTKKFKIRRYFCSCAGGFSKMLYRKFTKLFTLKDNKRYGCETLSRSQFAVTINLFPNIVLSTGDPAFNRTIYNGSSSQKSLGIMLTIAAIGVTLAAAYTTFAFWTFRGKVKMDDSSY